MGSIGTHITHSLEAGLSRDALLMCIMQILFVDTKRFFCKGGADYGYTRNTRRERMIVLDNKILLGKLSL